MTDLSIEMDTHQLERVIERISGYDPDKHGNFYVGVGRKAKDEVPRIASKLKSFFKHIKTDKFGFRSNQQYNSCGSFWRHFEIIG